MKNEQMKEKFMSIRQKYVGADVDIDFEKPLSEYGLESFNAIQLIVDLELECEIEFPDYVMEPEMFETAGTLYSCFSKIVSGTLEKY